VTAPVRPTIILLSVPGTLEGIDPLLRRAGVHLVRLPSMELRPIDPNGWLRRLERFPAPDTVVVTSRTAVAVGVRRWRRERGPFPPSIEFWAAGPGTAQALRQAGIRRVRRPRTIGARGVVKALARGPRRRVVYFRSALAGSGLSQTLRVQGHQVVDLVVYRSITPARLGAAARHDLSVADLLVATSPSALSALRHRLGERSFLRIARTTRLVVLGERSRRAARGHGFRRVSVANPTAAQRFTRRLLRELRDGSP